MLLEMIKKFRQEKWNEKNILLWSMFIATLLLNFYGVIGHTLWRDETQAWLIARDTVPTASSLFTVTSYEGHPMLWFLVLMPFAKLGVSPEFVMIISLGFVTLAQYLLLFKTKINIWFRLAISCAPIFVYYFVLPARSYSVALFLVVAIAVSYSRRLDHPILYGALLALLLQTLVIMGGFVVACGVCWFIESIIKRKEIGKVLFIKNAVGMSIVLASALLLLWEFRFTSSVVPGYSPSITEIIKVVVYNLVEGYQILFGGYAIIGILISVFVFLASIVYRGNSISLIVITVVGILWQCYIYGFVYNNTNNRILTWLAILIFYIIAFIQSDAFELTINDINSSVVVYIFALFIILFQWQYGEQPQYLYNKFSDMVDDINPRVVYSSGKEMAEYINGLPSDMPVFVSNSDYDSPVVAQVDRKHAIYNPFFQTKASFVDRNPENVENMDYYEFVTRAKEMFPDADYAYVIVEVGDEAVNINGIMDKVNDSREEVMIEYECPNNYLREKYCLLKVKIEG